MYTTCNTTTFNLWLNLIKIDEYTELFCTLQGIASSNACQLVDVSKKFIIN